MDGPAGSQKACLAVMGFDSRKLFFFAFFSKAFFSMCFDVGSILGGFGRPKRRPKSSFGRFFFDVFFECVSASIFCGIWEARTLKNQQKPLFFLWFLLIFKKSTFSKK